MGIRIATQPTAEPVTLEEVKLHCRIDHSDEDNLLNTLIAASRQFCETFTGRVFVRQTVEYTLGKWPSGRAIHLPLPPVQSITELKYKDEAGASVVLTAATDYIADTENARIVLPRGKTWPTETMYEVEPIVITYLAGWPQINPIVHTLEAVGTGDGTLKTFTLKNTPIVSGSVTVYLNGVLTTGYTLNLTTGVIVFTVAPLLGVAITATYTEAADLRANIPEYIKAAIKLLVAVYYENRENVLPAGHVGKTLPMGIDSLLWQHRNFWTPELNK
jgi:uncharacterized phiE125 gp8 family phage protein